MGSLWQDVENTNFRVFIKVVYNQKNKTNPRICSSSGVKTTFGLRVIGKHKAVKL